MGDQYQFSTQLHKVILNYLLNLHLDLLIVKLFIPRVDAFYFKESCYCWITRIMISKGMDSKGQYSNFGPGKGFEYSF